jgi:hypothetical protein
VGDKEVIRDQKSAIALRARDKEDPGERGCARRAGSHQIIFHFVEPLCSTYHPPRKESWHSGLSTTNPCCKVM